MTLKFRAGPTLFFGIEKQKRKIWNIWAPLFFVDKVEVEVSVHYSKSVNKRRRLSRLQKFAKPLDSKKHTRTQPLSLWRAVSKDPVLLSGFTGFLWTAGRFELERKGCGFKNTRMRVDGLKFPKKELKQ